MRHWGVLFEALEALEWSFGNCYFTAVKWLRTALKEWHTSWNGGVIVEFAELRRLSSRAQSLWARQGSTGGSLSCAEPWEGSGPAIPSAHEL